MAIPRFRKTVIGEVANPTGGGPMNTLITVGDLDADGRPDIAISGRNGLMAWFENGGIGTPWKRHLIDEIVNQECGGCLFDLRGRGQLDLLNGSDHAGTTISWWENPGVATGTWRRHEIANTGFGFTSTTVTCAQFRAQSKKSHTWTEPGWGRS